MLTIDQVVFSKELENSNNKKCHYYSSETKGMCGCFYEKKTEPYPNKDKLIS